MRVAVDAESVQRRPVGCLGVDFAVGFGEQVIHSLWVCVISLKGNYNAK